MSTNPRESFSVPWRNHSLVGDIQSAPGPVVLLHGAGAGESSRFTPLRDRLERAGLGSIAFDFVGHGRTGGDVSQSSLAAREDQALFFLKACFLKDCFLKDCALKDCAFNTKTPLQPLILWGSSMGGYNAIRLSKILKPAVLILSVPAVYHPAAYSVPFGPDFSRIIRQERSWEESDAWDILSTFEGHLLILAGGQDEVIPREVPERLYTCASRASSRQLKLFPDAGHHVVRYLENSPQEFDVLIALVRTLSTAPNAALKTDDL